MIHGLRLIKRRLKRRLLGLRAKYLAWRHPFGADDLRRFLVDLGVESGDILLVHSSLEGFDGYRDKVSTVVDVLQEIVGPTGTILMPTQPFRGTAIDFVKSGRVINVRTTPSEMGVISEIFRRSPGVIRSVHPTHPVAAWGPAAEELTRDHYKSKTPCGRGTPYSRFGDKNGKLLLLATGINVLTYYHSIEEDIESSLPHSPFTEETFEMSTVTEDGEIVQTCNRLYEPWLSRRRTMEPTVPYFKAAGTWREGRVGTLHAILLSSKDLRSVVNTMLKKHEYSYDLEGC